MSEGSTFLTIVDISTLIYLNIVGKCVESMLHLGGSVGEVRVFDTIAII